MVTLKEVIEMLFVTLRYKMTVTALFFPFVAFTLIGCNQTSSDSAGDKEEIKTVLVKVLGRADMDEVLSYVADLKPFTEVKIYSQVPDRILYFPWNDGDVVKVGQRVALIRKKGIDKGLEQLAAQLEALDVQIENQGRELKRARELLSSGVINQSAFDGINTAYLASLAQKKALQASRGQMSVTADNAEITAPINGIIAGKMLEKGDMAVPQVPLCQILSVDKLKAHLKLIEADVPKVKLKQSVVLHFDAYPDRAFSGQVTNILPYLDNATRTNTVEVTLENLRDSENENYLLKPGMFGLAELVVQKRENVLVVSQSALVLDKRIMEKQKSGELMRKVFVVDEAGTVNARVVRLGIRKHNQYEVLDGVKDGERVVVRGQHGLKDGQKVEIVSPQR